MPRIFKKRRNLEQREIDGSERKLKRTKFILKYSTCKQTSQSNFKITHSTQPTLVNQQSHQTHGNQPSHPTHGNQPTQPSQQTQGNQPNQHTQTNQQFKPS